MGKDKEKRIKIPEQIINDVQAYLTKCEDLKRRAKRIHTDMTRKISSIEAEGTIECNKMWALISEHIPEANDNVVIDPATMELVERQGGSPLNFMRGLGLFGGGGSQWGVD